MMFLQILCACNMKQHHLPRISATINTWKVLPFRWLTHFRHSLISAICRTAATAMRLLSLLAHSKCKTLNGGSLMISVCVRCTAHGIDKWHTQTHQLSCPIPYFNLHSYVSFFIATFWCMCWLDSQWTVVITRLSHGNTPTHKQKPIQDISTIPWTK